MQMLTVNLRLVLCNIVEHTERADVTDKDAVVELGGTHS